MSNDIEQDEPENYLNNIDIEDHLVPVFTVYKNQETSSSTTTTAVTGISASTATSTKEAIRKTPKISYEENIPIMVCHISRIEVPREKSNNFNDLPSIHGIRFKTLTIYGRIIPVRMKQKNNLLLSVYKVDDGTEQVTVHWSRNIKKHNKLMENINYLSHELNVYQKHNRCGGDGKLFPPLPAVNDDQTGGNNIRMNENQKQNDLIVGMHVIMNKIRKQTCVPDKFFQPLFNVSVIGRPFRYTYRGKNEIRISALEIQEDSGPDRQKEIFFKRHLIRYYETKF